MNNKVGMWVALAFLVALVIGGYAFYQKGSGDIEKMKQEAFYACVHQKQDDFRIIFSGTGLEKDITAIMNQCNKELGNTK